MSNPKNSDKIPALIIFGRIRGSKVDQAAVLLKNRRGTRPPVGIETVVLYPGCGRERPSTFWWRVTP